MHAAAVDRAIKRKTELALRLEPGRIAMIARAFEVFEHIEQIAPDEMPKHEAIMQRRAPAHQRAMLRRAPEPRNQRAQKKLLRKTHARVGRHFEGAEFDKAQSPGRAVRREQFIDADFGAMGVAGDVDQEMPEQPVDQPGRRRVAIAGRRHARKRDLHFVKLILPRLVHARRLAGRPDEQSGEQIRQGRDGAANRE